MIFDKDTPEALYKIVSLAPDDIHLGHLSLKDDAVFRYEGDNNWDLVHGSFSYNSIEFSAGDTGADYLSFKYGATIEPVSYFNSVKVR